MKNALSILIVEDDSNSAFVLKTILQKAGYEILPIASDGKSALELTKKYHPALVLMDITLPGELDGIDTALTMHHQYDVPVVYLTGHTSEQIIKRAKATVPYGFILKPYTAKMVLVTTEMAFHKAAVERESKETKLRLAVTLGSLLSPIFSATPQGIINYVNQAGQNFLGIPMGQILNRSLDEVLPLYLPENQQDQKKSSFLDFLLEAKPNILDRHAIFLNKKGENRHVYVQVTSLKNLYGDVQGYVVALNDFSEQFYFEQRNQMLAAALKQLQEGVIVVERCKDFDFRMVYVNQGLLNCLKMTIDDWIGKPLSVFFGVKFNMNIVRALEHARVYSADTVMICSDGEEKVTNWTLSPFALSDQKIEYIVITVRDVTLLRCMEENLRESQKIEAVGRLASGIAHDFNNLLAIINGCSDLALSQTTDAKFIDYLKSIQNAGSRGAMLVQQLMLFARKGTTDEVMIEEVSTREKLEQTLHMLKHYLGSNITFETRLGANLWNVKIPATYLDQILVNLCVNGRDAMPQGGKMLMEFQNFEGCPPDLLQGCFLKITVQDTGIGMDMETQKKIFEPFFTTKPVGEGTGLGLSSVYGLIKHYDGSIQVESALNCGTIFTLYLPACDETESVFKPITENLVCKKKICQLNVEKSIEVVLKPCLLKEGWCVYCQDEKPEEKPQCVISHEPTADVYVPKTFSKNSSIKHPYAIVEILNEVRRWA